MCGRLTISLPPDELALQLGLDPEALSGLTPRYNAAPTQLLPVLRLATNGQPELVPLRWGLIPGWARPGSSAARGFVNARVDTVTEKPSFREAAEERRCLIPADGFLEWETLAKKKKQPHWFRLNGGQPFAFAGLWEPPVAGTKFPEGTVTILTVDATADVWDYHDRMPAMLLQQDFSRWLNAPDWPAALAVLTPWPKGSVTHFPVNPEINTAGVERPELLQEVVPRSVMLSGPQPDDLFYGL